MFPFLHILGQIRQFMDKSTAEGLIHAFVLHHVDKYDSHLHGLSDSQLNRIKRI